MLDISNSGKAVVIVALVYAYFCNFKAHQRLPRWWYILAEKRVFCYGGSRAGAAFRFVLGFFWGGLRAAQVVAMSFHIISYYPQDADAKMPLNVWWWINAIATAELIFATLWGIFQWMWTADEQDEDNGNAEMLEGEDRDRGRWRTIAGLVCIVLCLICTVFIAVLSGLQETWVTSVPFMVGSVMYFMASVLSLRTLYVLDHSKTPTTSWRERRVRGLREPLNP